ncbi:MAG: hypothetical protein HY581_05740 [Nitrospirae bacterium]|nr:hypothetical protein [Nitrospirota bacterium]
MRRNLEPVDLMVAVGILATVLGGYFLFMSTSGTLQAAVPETASIAPASGIMGAMEWVQPALGQAIVDDYLLGREFAAKTTEAVTKLNRATMITHRLKTSPFEYLEQIQAHATQVEADHAARVQFVMGRSIVDFTARGVRTGVLSPGLVAGEYNRRMISIAETTGKTMDVQFRSNWPTLIKQTILAASEDHDRFAAQSQQRVGHAIVQLTRVQDGYLKAMEDMQVQLGSVALASIHTEQIADRFDQLAAADFSARRPTLPFSAPRSWPEIPFGYLFAASAVLIGIFFVGLLMPGLRRETEEMEEREAEPAKPGYRKTA